MPVQGFVRNRSHQLGKQTVLGTAVAATRRVHWTGTPDRNVNWTPLDGVDVGSIDPVLDPYRMQTDISVPYSGPLDFNSFPALMGSGVKGGVAATGGTAAKTWVHQAVSLTATTLDYLTDEWSDDVTGDGIRMVDGVFESLEFSFDENLGPWQFTAQGRYGKFDPRVTQTSGLTVGSNLPLLFGADTTLYIDSTAAGIGSTAVVDSLHKAMVKIDNTIDQKRYANGSNSRFALAGYGLAGRAISGSLWFAKQSVITGATGEAAQMLTSTATTRYLQLSVTSPALIGATATPYSWQLRLPVVYTVRGDEEIGGNSVVRLDFIGKYDGVLGYALLSTAVNDRATSP